MPDYYDVIKNPRDLGTIKKNLIRKKYETPQEFYEVRHIQSWSSFQRSGLMLLARLIMLPYEPNCHCIASMVPLCCGAIALLALPRQRTSPVAQDMHLFFGNIYTYNGTNSNFGKLGSRVEGLFEVSTSVRCRPRIVAEAKWQLSPPITLHPCPTPARRAVAVPRSTTSRD